MSNKKKKMIEQRKAINKKAPLTAEQSAKKTRRIIITVICVILALAIILGAVLGIITAVRNSSYVMKADRVGIDKGVANYLISLYKYDYVISYEGAKDTDEFWNKARVTGTEGDLFNLQATRHLKQIVAANALFDQYTKLTKDDKKRIDLAVNEVLNFKASGSENTFNEKAKDMGFDFDDFKKASEMIYKANIVAVRVFGENGANMPSLFGDFCDSFYEDNYVKAKILIIRTENTFAYETDSNGEFVLDEKGEKIPIYDTDEDGNKIHRTRPLSTAEKAERLDYIARLDSLVAQLTEKPDSVHTRNTFDSLLEEIAVKYDENVLTGVTDGYYLFRKSYVSEDYGKEQIIRSSYTERLGLDHIVKQAYALETNEIYVYESGAAVDDDSTDSYSYKCYVVKENAKKGAYSDSSLEHFFRDFNALAAYFLYAELIEEKTDDVKLTKKWDAIDPVAIPMNKDLYVLEF